MAWGLPATGQIWAHHHRSEQANLHRKLFYSDICSYSAQKAITGLILLRAEMSDEKCDSLS